MGTSHDMPAVTTHAPEFPLRSVRRIAQRLAANVAFAALLGSCLYAGGCCCGPMITDDGDGFWDPVISPCLNGVGGCGSCGTSCGGGIGQAVASKAGCGEMYWGEWTSNPPDDCDPCDNGGNWVGPRSCPPRFWELFCGGMCGLWGWRCGGYGCETCGGYGGFGGGCGSGGCENCAAGGDEYYPEGADVYLEEGSHVTPGQPVPATKAPTKALPMPGDPGPAPADTPAKPAPDAQTRYGQMKRGMMPSKYVPGPHGVRPASATSAPRKRGT